MGEALRGNLDRVSLSGVLQLLESESLHGRLRLDRGEIASRNGALTEARYRGLTGVVAVLEALVTARGSFTFDDAADVPNGSLGSTPGLVMESCRIIDDLERLGPIHFARADGWAPKIDDLDLRLFARALDGTRPAVDLIAERDLHVVPTVRWLEARAAARELRPMGQTEVSALERLRAITAAAAVTAPATADRRPAAPAPAPAPAAPIAAAITPEAGGADDLIFEARSASREGRYEDAERALLQALSLRPGDRIAAQNLTRVRRLIENRT